jgi:hypothetical protein
VLVRVKLNFVLNVATDHLPSINILDFIEKGCETMESKVTMIEPGAKISIGVALPMDRRTLKLKDPWTGERKG